MHKIDKPEISKKNSQVETLESFNIFNTGKKLEYRKENIFSSYFKKVDKIKRKYSLKKIKQALKGLNHLKKSHKDLSIYQ